MSDVGRVVRWMELMCLDQVSATWTRVQYLWWKFLHVFYARLILVVVAGFLKDVYTALQKWDCRQGMFLNCFSCKQLLPRDPNTKWQGLSYVLTVITRSVLVAESRLAASVLFTCMSPLGLLRCHCGWNYAKAWNSPPECFYSMELRVSMSWDVVYEVSEGQNLLQ